MFFPLSVFWRKLSLILCLNELILSVDFKSEDTVGYSIFLARSRTGIFGQHYFCEMEGVI